MTARKIGLLFTLMLILNTGCSSATPSLGDASQARFESEELFPQGMLLTVPGMADEENKYLPAVRISSVIIDSERRKHYKPCSKALEGIERVTGIIDNKSLCATTTTMTTTVYSSQNGRRGTRTEEYSGTVMVHEQFRMVMGVRRKSPPGASTGSQAKPTVVWTNADLAAIFLKEAVSAPFEPVQLALTEEIKKRSRVIIIGYGPGSSPHIFGERQYGENVVTGLIPLETGSVLFRTELQELPEGGPASYAEPGDSGGACVAKMNPRVLVGFVTVGAQKRDGSYMSYFTSVYSHRDWLERMLKRAKES